MSKYSAVQYSTVHLQYEYLFDGWSISLDIIHTWGQNPQSHKLILHCITEPTTKIYEINTNGERGESEYCSNYTSIQFKYSPIFYRLIEFKSQIPYSTFENIFQGISYWRHVSLMVYGSNSTYHLMFLRRRGSFV